MGLIFQFLFVSLFFSLTMHCSFMLAKISLLGFGVQQEKPQGLFTLKGKGKLRTEMRFAKGQVFTFFEKKF